MILRHAIYAATAASLIAIRHQTGVGLVRTFPSVPQRILELDQPDRPLDAHAMRNSVLPEVHLFSPN